MSKRDVDISFVLEHYKEGIFRPDDFIKAMRRKFPETERKRSRNIFLRRAAGLIGAAAVILCAVLIHQNRWVSYRSYDVSQAFTLSDSSRVTLRPGTELRHRRGDSRSVFLSGKAIFEVMRHEGKTFTVSCGDALVSVLGTEFQVSGSDSVTVIDVFSGKVQAENGLSSKVLESGMSASVSAEAITELRQGLNPAGWGTGVFRYSDTPLEDVIRDLEDNFGVKLSLSLPSEKDGDNDRPKLTGIFETADLEEIIDIINAAMGVTVTVEKR